MARSNQIVSEAARALAAIQAQIRWRPGRAMEHLAKRKLLGHLPDPATIEDYEALIVTVVAAAGNLVYHYPFGGKSYYAVSGVDEGAGWLVMFGADGVMETAFPPDDLDAYLATRGLSLLGSVEDVLHG